VIKGAGVNFRRGYTETYPGSDLRVGRNMPAIVIRTPTSEQIYSDSEIQLQFGFNVQQ